MGSNLFENVPFPLSLNENRYFIINDNNGQYSISVITSNENIAEFEIVNNKPVSNTLSHVFLTDKKTLVVCSLEDGNLVYKVNIGQEIALTYLEPDNPVLIKINPDRILIGKSSFSGNTISGVAVGIILFKNGGFALGASRIAPGPVSELYRSAFGRK
jgi:hypothetical protein